jgi:hypothetical protein
MLLCDVRMDSPIFLYHEIIIIIIIIIIIMDCLCGLVVRVLGYRSRFPGLPDFLRSSGPGTGSTQPRECN